MLLESEAEALRVPESLIESDADIVKVVDGVGGGVTERVAEDEVDNDDESDSVDVGSSLPEADVDIVKLAVAVGVVEFVGEQLAVGVGVAVHVVESVVVDVTEAVIDGVNVGATEIVVDTDSEPETVSSAVTEPDPDAVSVPEVVSSAVPLPVNVGVGTGVRVSVTLKELEAEISSVRVAEIERVVDRVSVTDVVTDCGSDTDTDWDGVIVGGGVTVGLSDVVLLEDGVVDVEIDNVSVSVAVRAWVGDGVTGSKRCISTRLRATKYNDAFTVSKVSACASPHVDRVGVERSKSASLTDMLTVPTIPPRKSSRRILPRPEIRSAK